MEIALAAAWAFSFGLPQLAASFISNHRRDVAFWHVASIWTDAENGRFRGKADKNEHQP
jgi:hypothetical protein